VVTGAGPSPPITARVQLGMQSPTEMVMFDTPYSEQ
jgi:hypothetical protein